MRPEELRRRQVEGIVLLEFALEIYRLQLDAGRRFLHENPQAASSWDLELVKVLRADPRVGEVVGHQCQYGQVARTPDGLVRPVKKPTRFLSSAPAVLEALPKT